MWSSILSDAPAAAAAVDPKAKGKAAAPVAAAAPAEAPKPGEVNRNAAVHAVENCDTWCSGTD